MKFNFLVLFLLSGVTGFLGATGFDADHSLHDGAAKEFAELVVEAKIPVMSNISIMLEDTEVCYEADISVEIAGVQVGAHVRACAETAAEAWCEFQEACQEPFREL